MAIAFSPDGRLLAAGHHNRLNVWDTTTGTIALTWDPNGYCGGLAFSPDGQHLAAIHNGHDISGYAVTVTVWSLARPRDLVVHGRAVSTHHKTLLWFHPDSSWLLTCQYPNSPKRWELADGTVRNAWAEDPQPRGVEPLLSPRGDHLYRRGEEHQSLELLDPTTGRVARTWKPITSLWSWGTFLLLNERHLVVFAPWKGRPQLLVEDLVEGREVLRRSYGRKTVRHVAIGPTGDKVIAAPDSKEVWVWTPPDWPEPQVYSWPIGKVTRLAVAPDGQRAAAGGSSGQVIIWDLDA
jgi:WD40 repeat protein